MNAQLEKKKQVVILKDTVECQYVDNINYTSCIDASTTDDIINPLRIKEIYPPYNVAEDTPLDKQLETLTQNGEVIHLELHLTFRSLLLSIETIIVYEKSISKDKFHQLLQGNVVLQALKMALWESICLINPQALVNGIVYLITIGIDDLGNIFVLDSGNHFMRIIDPYGLKHCNPNNMRGEVKTLIHGSCRQSFGKGPKGLSYGLSQKYLTCYRYHESKSLTKLIETGLRHLDFLMTIFGLL